MLAIVTHDDDSSGGGQTTTLRRRRGTLRAHVAAGNLTLEGPVREANEKSVIESAASDRFGKSNVVSNLQVDATAESAAWLATAIAALPRKDSGTGRSTSR